jgi:hypothetical protein
VRIFFYIRIGPQVKKLKSDTFGGKASAGSNGLPAKGKKPVDSDDDDDDDESVSNGYCLFKTVRY